MSLQNKMQRTLDVVKSLTPHFFFQYWSLNRGLELARQVLYPLIPKATPFCFRNFSNMVSHLG
jgi:hypothetical protein